MSDEAATLPALVAINTRKHAKYARKLPEYSPLYESTDRAIKRWIRRGKELHDLPPLDDPPAMAGWWRRSMDHQVPDKLLAFARPLDPRAVSGDAGSGAGQPSDPPPPTTPRDFSNVKSLDITENVEALRYTLAINKHLLDEAVHAAVPDENIITLRQKNYERGFELLRKAESTLIDLQRQRGNLIDKEAVRMELAQVFESLRLMHEGMPRRIIVALEALLPRRLTRIFRVLEKFLLPAIEKARADEEAIFRQLETFDGPDAVRELLAA